MSMLISYNKGKLFLSQKVKGQVKTPTNESSLILKLQPCMKGRVSCQLGLSQIHNHTSTCLRTMISNQSRLLE